MSKNIKSDTLLDSIKNEHHKFENKFPIEIFPDELKEFVEEVNSSLSLNLDYVSCSVLMAFSTAIGNLFKLKIKEGFYQKANLWLVIIGRAGDGKSPSIDIAMKPLEKLEEREYKQFKLNLNDWKQIENNCEPKPVFKNYILKDFTFEALCKSHEMNDHGICVYADEILSWIKSFGRYSNSSEENNYLTIWNGGSFKISRKTTGDLRIDETFVNVIGGLQKGRLNELKKNNEQSGFLDRFLFCFPKSDHLYLLNKNTIDDRVIKNYEVLFERIFEKYKNYEMTTVEFSNDAFQKIIVWQNSWAKNYVVENDTLFSMSKKMENYLYRFSLLIEVICSISEDRMIREVTLSSVEKAIKLISYFEINSIKFRDKKVSKIDGLNKNQKLIYLKLPDFFDTNDIKRVSKELDISTKTISRALKDENYYSRIAKGKYKKIA